VAYALIPRLAHAYLRPSSNTAVFRHTYFEATNLKLNKAVDRSFFSVGPKLWNSLPQSLRPGALACIVSVLSLLLIFCVSISWQLPLVASRLIRFCSRLLLFSEWLCESEPIAHRALSRIYKIHHFGLCLANRPLHSTNGEKVGIFVILKIPKPYLEARDRQQ